MYCFGRNIITQECQVWNNWLVLLCKMIEDFPLDGIPFYCGAYLCNICCNFTFQMIVLTQKKTIVESVMNRKELNWYQESSTSVYFINVYMNIFSTLPFIIISMKTKENCFSLNIKYFLHFLLQLRFLWSFTKYIINAF